jgi:hypothetical protein
MAIVFVIRTDKDNLRFLRQNFETLRLGDRCENAVDRMGMVSTYCDRDFKPVFLIKISDFDDIRIGWDLRLPTPAESIRVWADFAYIPENLIDLTLGLDDWRNSPGPAAQERLHRLVRDLPLPKDAAAKPKTGSINPVASIPLPLP